MEYYYFDYLYKEIGFKTEDINSVPSMGRADDVCNEIACKDYIIEQFADVSFQSLKYAVCCLCDNPTIESRHDALMYLVWIAALDIKEQRVLT